jgi:hypothetical protein
METLICPPIQTLILEEGCCCDELVCPLCIAKTHNKQHDLIEISEGYQIKAEKIRNGQKNIDQKINDFRNVSETQSMSLGSHD